MRGGDWLEERLAKSPEPLRERLEAVVGRLDPNQELYQALLGAATELLDGVRGRLELRDSAFDLLVADGLLTLACEAVAFSDPDHLVEGCRAMGPDGELGRIAGRWARRVEEHS
ncbi:MAG: hypothetical protein JSU87_06615 [Gemmatimonadota bacterium]|nr:MAG: hypothetical protein JSU87_06615 [Gemmatimonadota bacterium]